MSTGISPRAGSRISEYNRGREALRRAGPHDVGNFDLVEAINRALDRPLRVMGTCAGPLRLERWPRLAVRRSARHGARIITASS